MICSKCNSSAFDSQAYCRNCGTLGVFEINRSDLAKTGVNSAPQALVFARNSKFLMWLLLTVIVLEVVSGFSMFMQLNLFDQMSSGYFASQFEMTQAAVANDKRQQIIGSIYFLVFLLCVITFCLWIYSAVKNLEAKGVKDLDYTAGWAVGWYFIPFANLWKPYLAMKQVWQASCSPNAWKATKRGKILPWWWGSFLLSNMVANLVFKNSIQQNLSIEALMEMTRMHLGSSVLSAIATFIAYSIVKEVRDLQLSWRSI